METPHDAQSNWTDIRKLYRPGHSHALCLPAKWVKSHIDPNRPYVTLTFNADGTITIAPLDRIIRRPTPAQRPDRLGRPKLARQRQN